MTDPKDQPSWRPTLIERSTGAWQNLMTSLNGRLAYLRQQNDKNTNTDAETAFLRGQIAEVKRLLDLNNDLPELPG